MTLKLASAHDATAPYTAKASGRLVATRVTARVGCVGAVTLVGRNGARTLVRGTAKLRLIDGACEYTATLTVTRKQRGRARAIRISASFAGNAALLAAASPTRTFRLG